MVIGIIIQARTGSSRLPGKMVMPFYGDKSILQILIERIKAAVPGVPVIVATSTQPGDDRIEDICRLSGVECYRGDENDVLSRFTGAADKYALSHVIRICADNTFLDMRALNKLAQALPKSQADYLSYRTHSGLPTILTHHGLWAIEGAKAEALQWVASNVADPKYHEHVTNYLYTHPDQFTAEYINIDSSLQDKDNLRLTIDTRDDFDMMKEIYAYLTDNHLEITPDNIVRYIDTKPEFYAAMQRIINQNKKQ